MNTIQDGDVTYEPWTDGHAVGFKAVRTDGQVEYVYLNPSARDGEPDSPNVFVYHGSTGDASEDTPYHHYDLFVSDDEEEQPTSEERARDLTTGDRFAEIGMDEIHTAKTITYFGDSVLVITVDDTELALDGDEVVWTYKRKP